MARKLKVDFSGVEEYVRCEEGEHVAILKEITEEEASTGNDMLVGKFEVIQGESKGAIVYNNFVLVEKALWRLKGMMTALGVKVPEGKFTVDLDSLEGKKLIINVIHTEYNGSPRSEIESYKKLSGGKKVEDADEDEDEDEDEAPPAKKSKKAPDVKKSKKAVEPEDEDEEEEEEAPPKKASKKPKKAPEPEPEDEDEDEEEEEEEPAAKKSSKKSAKEPPAKAKGKGKKAPVDDDDDEDWEED